MRNGWIRLYRELLEKPIWKCSTPEQKTILITLLLMANHKENEWVWGGRRFKVKKGEFVTSLESIRKSAGKNISIKQIRNALSLMENLDFLAMKTAKTGRIITILNWEKYQPTLVPEGQRSGQTRGKQGATNNNERSKIDNKLSMCPQQPIVDVYHEVLPELPQVRVWSEKRQKMLRQRWREDPKRQSLDWWRKLFEWIRESDFLMGKVPPAPGRKQFIADLEWIITQSNFIKIIEGKYHQ